MPRHRIHYDIITEQSDEGWSASIVVSCADLPDEVIYDNSGHVWPTEDEALADLRTAIADLTRMGLQIPGMRFGD